MSNNENKKAITTAHRLIPFLTLFAAMLMWHFTLPTDIGDDTWFREILPVQPGYLNVLLDYLISRYNNWTSRIFIEAFAVTVTHSPIVWSILDSIVLTAIPYLILIIIGHRNNMQAIWAACAFMFVYPLNIMSTAGWMTTTIFYSWPFLFGLIAMLPFAFSLCNKPLSWGLSVICVPSLLIGCNNEQICLFLLGLSVIICIFLLAEHRRIHAILIIEVLLMIASLVFILTCPGNWNRMVQETNTWFIGFDGVSNLTKFELGFSSTGYLLVMEKNWLFALFCILLAIVVWRVRKNVFDRSISFIPIAACLLFGFLPEYFQDKMPHISLIRARLATLGTGFTFATPATWIPDACLFVVFICTIYSLIRAFNCSEARALAIGLLIIGLGTRVMIGFSPTIWVSGGRTASFLYFSLLMLAIMLIARLSNLISQKSKAVLSLLNILLFCIFFISYISS